MTRLPLPAGALAVALFLALAACGDSAPAAPAPKEKSGRPLTAGELEDALRRRAEADPKALEAAVRRASDELGRHLGGDTAEQGRRAKELSERRLAASDVERYLELLPVVKAEGAKATTFSGRELSLLEWQVLRGRIDALVMMLRLPSPPRDPGIAADLETVRPFAARLDAARSAR